MDLDESVKSDHCHESPYARYQPGGLTNNYQQPAVLEMPNRWPTNVIPCEIDRAFSLRQRNNIIRAFRQYFDKTCVRFVQRNNEHDYIFIKRAPGQKDLCSSVLGYEGGQHRIVLNDYCVEEQGIIVHELMHVLGFDHEQSRADRDQ
jgi:hypothetical protein